MRNTSIIRYRTEAFSGSGVRDAAEVMAFETFELGNTDILETLLNEFLFASDELKIKCLNFICELNDNGFVDDLTIDDRVDFFNEVLGEIEKVTGVTVKYALWLADKDVATNKSFYGRDMFNEDDFDAYEIGPVVLSDLGHDGTLYGYTELPVPLEKEALNDVIQSAVARSKQTDNVLDYDIDKDI